MKKFLVLGVVTSMLMATTALAANELTSGNNSQEITVNYTVGQSYTIIIPSDLNLVTEDSAPAQLVAAKNVRLNSDENLTVTMTSANYDNTEGYRVSFEGDSHIKYEVKKGTTEDAVNEKITDNNVELLNLTSGTTEDSLYLKFYTTDQYIKEAIKAGKHTDVLTFACEVE